MIEIYPRKIMFRYFYHSLPNEPKRIKVIIPEIDEL
jgi:hypothetical protein